MLLCCVHASTRNTNQVDLILLSFHPPRSTQATSVLSPAVVDGTARRATRSGRRFSSIGAAEESPPPLLLEEEGPPDPISQFCLLDGATGAAAEASTAAPAAAAAGAAAGAAAAEGGNGKGKRRRSSRGNLPFSPEADEDEPAAQPSVAGTKRPNSFLTPGGTLVGAGATSGKRKRSSVGGAAAVAGAGGLTAAEVDRYTHSALKGKGWKVHVHEVSGRGGGGGAGNSSVEYELRRWEEVMVVERRGPFATEAEALADARGDGPGKAQDAALVTLEEVTAHADACPYRPIIAEMEAARGRLSEGACAGGASYVPGVREAEAGRMLAFYQHHLLRGANAGTGGGGGWLRVAGLPGTGKTIAVQHSEERLRAALARKGITACPTFVHVNAAARSGPLEMLRKVCGDLGVAGADRADAETLWAQLEERLVGKPRGGRPSTASSAASSSTSTSFMASLMSPVKAINSFMTGVAASSSAKGSASPELIVAPAKASEVAGRAVVLVLDEMDQFLAGRKPNAEWLQRLVEGVLLDRGSRLLLVTIANTVEEQSTLGALWAKATAARGGDENASPRASQSADPGRAPVIFSAFSSDELKALLAGAVGGVMHERGLDLIVKRVETSRGDARLAMDVCRRALEARVRALEGKARAWCLADDPQPVVKPEERQVSIPEANAVSRELDLDVAKAVESMPQMAKLLLLVLLRLAGEAGAGGKVKPADLQAEYTAQARATVGAMQLSASGCFETNLDWLDQNGLIERAKGRGAAGRAVAPKVDWATVLPKLKEHDKRLFSAILPAQGK